MTQMGLFDVAPLPVTTERKQPTLEERFAAFNEANPSVMASLLRLASARMAAGGTRIGVKALWEELRAELVKKSLSYDGFGIPRADAEAFKLNNSFTALYARELIKLEPSLANVIELRKRKGER